VRHGSTRRGPVGDLLVENSQHHVHGVVHTNAGVSETAHSADDGDHRVGAGETKSKPDPVLQSLALRVAGQRAQRQSRREKVRVLSPSMVDPAVSG
jgi:hypothetical protein